MANNFRSRLANAWYIFRKKDNDPFAMVDQGMHGIYARERSSSFSPYITPKRRSTDRSVVASVYNRIAIDVSSMSINHIETDEKTRKFKKILFNSSINTILNLSANIDQTGRTLIIDTVLSLCDEGVIAIVPVDTDVNPLDDTDVKIESVRVAKIVEWFPTKIRVNIYNDTTGVYEDVIVPKSICAIVENPFYSVMNNPSSTLQRLIRKLDLLDIIDEQSASGKLDLIIQLPYVVKSEALKQRAEQRRTDLELQLKDSKYGIGYIDGTERVTQLNRPVENNLLKQVEYLTSMLFSQLGITQAILDGSADESTMLNYFSRTVAPFLRAIGDEVKRKWIPLDRIEKGESIKYFRDPFEMVTAKDMAELSDKLTRNEILSSNEVRGVFGYEPSTDPKADELRNSNINQNKSGEGVDIEGQKQEQVPTPERRNQNGSEE